VIILMGVAGSGKSMQGRLFADELGYAWISTGELLRAQVTGERRKEIAKGKLLNDQEVIELVDKTLTRLDLTHELVFDGFPRTKVQAEWLVDQFKKGRLKLTGIFNLKASEDVVTKRLLARGRNDDTSEVIKERFKEYDTKTLPILGYFKESGVVVYDIDADQEPSKVHKSMTQYIPKQ
jgi:adenylate kinase